jgi:excisionase family DNA binding protein
VSWLKVSEAAARLNVTAALVYGLCAAGRIEHVRHGLGRGTIRISEEALDRYLAGTVVPAAGPTDPPAHVPAPPAPRRPVSDAEWLRRIQATATPSHPPRPRRRGIAPGHP